MKDIFRGNLIVKGNLYLTDDYNPKKLSERGITIHVKKNIYFKSSYEFITHKFTEDDVFIDGVFDKFMIKDIIGFSDVEVQKNNGMIHGI